MCFCTGAEVSVPQELSQEKSSTTTRSCAAVHCRPNRDDESEALRKPRPFSAGMSRPATVSLTFLLAFAPERVVTMFTKYWKCMLFVVTLVGLFMTATASASTIAAFDDEQVAWGTSCAAWGTNVGSTDILAGLTPAAATGTWPNYADGYGAGGVSVLTDGILGPIGGPGGSDHSTHAMNLTYAGPAGGSSAVDNSVTYTFVQPNLTALTFTAAMSTAATSRGSTIPCP